MVASTVTNLMVYHGSKRIIAIEDIKFPGPRENCDFGSGFYVTDNKHTAEEWIINEPDPVVNAYHLDIDSSKVLFLEGSDWIRAIVGFRKKIYKVTFKSNIISGPIANDRMVPAINLFMEGIIGDLRLLRCLDYCKLGNQYVFRSSAEGLTPYKSYGLANLQLQQAATRWVGRRRRMNDDLKIIQRTPISGELYIDDYLHKGDFLEV